MKYAALSLAYATALLVTPAAAIAEVDAVACYSVNDGDARTHCLARARSDTGQCYSIKRAYLRSQCLAEVRK